MIKPILLLWSFKRRKDGHVRRSGIVPDGVTSAEANPLGNGTVLLLGFSKLLLGPESLVALLKTSRSASGCVTILAAVECPSPISTSEISA